MQGDPKFEKNMPFGNLYAGLFPDLENSKFSLTKS
jgi:hypothetical protein